MEHSREDIAPEVIGAEPMRSRGGQEFLLEARKVGVIGPVHPHGRKKSRSTCHQGKEENNKHRDAGHRVRLEAA